MLEGDVRFSSRYGVIGLRLYTRMHSRRGVGKSIQMVGQTCVRWVASYWQQVERAWREVFFRVGVRSRAMVVGVSRRREHSVGMASPLTGYQKRIRRGREGTKDDIRPRRVRVVCGSLREVHLLLRGVLQTRHQVTAARLEIRDPLYDVLSDSQVLPRARGTRASLSDGASS